jgi:signal transduction histidine kinase
MNLLHNAVKFNKQAGTVEVTLERLEGAVRVAITDSGAGISDSDQKTLFQRFVQGDSGKRNTGGTGLGLYLSRKIVEAHQGSIVCQSELGSGTTMVITLPVTQTVDSQENVSHAD